MERSIFYKSFTSSLLTIVSIAAITLSACKKEDELAPTFDIILPELNDNHVAGDPIPVSILVSDNKNIDFVKASLTDGDSKSYGQTTKQIQSYTPFEEVVVGLEIPTDAFMNPAEEFYVRIEANDGFSEQVKYRQIQISISDKEVKGFVVVTGDSTNYQVQMLDTNYTVSQSYSHSGGFGDALINSKDGHLVVAGCSTGDLVSYDCETGSSIWTLTNQNGVPEGYVREMYFNKSQKDLYLSLNTGEIQTYSTSGTARGGFMLQDNSKRAESMFATDEKLYFEQSAVNDTFNYVHSLFLGTWVTHFYELTNFDLIKIAEADDSYAKVFVNQGSEAYYYNFNLTNGNYESIVSLPSGEVKEVIPAGNQGFILRYIDEVYYFNKQNNFINQIHDGAQILSCAFNEDSQEILIGDIYGTVYVGTTGGGIVHQFYAGGPILDLEIWYNK